jgi:hypothetical protein
MGDREIGRWKDGETGAAQAKEVGFKLVRAFAVGEYIHAFVLLLFSM